METRTPEDGFPYIDWTAGRDAVMAARGERFDLRPQRTLKLTKGLLNTLAPRAFLYDPFAA